jgi:hypothetical protein
MVGMRFLLLLVRCLPSRDIPAGREILRRSLFSGAAPDSKSVVKARRLAEMPFAGRDVGRGFFPFFNSTQAPISHFFDISLKTLINQWLQAKKYFTICKKEP